MDLNKTKRKEVFKAFTAYLTNVQRLSSLSVRNYLSDLNHFWDWLEKNRQLLTIDCQEKLNLTDLSDLSPIWSINIASLEKYKNYILGVGSAKSTIKRRLATIRTFCQFCFSQGWLKQNLSLTLINPSKIKIENKEIHDIISQFGTFLRDQNASKNTVKNYVADVRNFLQYAANQKGN